MGFVKLIIRLLFALLLLIVVAAVAAYFYLNSDTGRGWLAEEASQRASAEGRGIRIHGLRGELLRDVGIAEVILSDAKGVWLELRDIRIVWQAVELLHKRPPLSEVTIGSVNLLRLPETGEAPGETPEEADIPPLRELAAWLPKRIALAEIAIQEAVAGHYQRLSLNGDGNAEAYNLHLATLEGVETALDATLVPLQRDFKLQLAFREAPGGIVGALLTLPTDTPLSVTADLAADLDGAVQIHAAEVKTGELALQADGQYRPEDATVSLKARLNAPDMKLAQALSGTPVSGSLKADLTAEGGMEALDLTLGVTSPHLVADGNRLGDIDLRGQAKLNPAAWGKPDFHAEGQLDGTLTHDDKPVAVRTVAVWKEEVLTVSDFSARYDRMEAKGNLTAKGTAEAFDLKADTTLAAPEGTSTLQLDGQVDRAESRYKGEAKGRFMHRNRPFDFAASLNATPQLASVKALSLKGPGIALTGDLDIQPEAQLADGRLKLDAPDLKPLGELLAEPLAGSVRVDIALASSGQRQQADIDAVLRNLQAAGVTVAEAELTLKAEDVKALDRIDASGKARNIDAGNITLREAAASAKGSLEDQLALQFDGKGQAGEHPWQLTLASQAEKQGETYRLDIAELRGGYAGAPIALRGPATLTYAPDRQELTPMTLAVAGGTVTAGGRITPQSVAGEVVVSKLALERIPIVEAPEGVMDAKLTIAGTAHNPVLDWDISGQVDAEGIPVKLTADGDWKAGKIAADARILAQESETTATLRLNAPLSLLPFEAGLTPETPLAGEVKTHLPLTMLNARLRPEGHRVEGVISGQAVLQGSLGAPVFDGEFTLADGRYDHEASGICLRGMQASLRGTRQAVELTSFQATDPKGRRFTAAGKLGLAGTPTLSGGAKFDRFRLFCGGVTRGEIDGALDASGTLEAMSLTGDLTLDPLNIQIPAAREHADIPQVETEWLTRGKAPAKADAKPGVMALDIRLHAPARMFVRGRGLDAEFEGKMHITGTATEPKLDGKFSHRRGTFTLLDRVLKLTDASLLFEGPIPPSPFLTANATTTVNGTTITVGLTGSASKPSLALKSSPSLPQDEVLALLLFGRRLDKISPFQALKLAQATRQLAGLDGGGPGLLGSLRNTLGLDRLDVDTDDQNNVSVSTGKYVTDKVYVGVRQGSTPEEREVVTEIELTPSVSGKTRMDGEGNQGVGLEWKYDY